jgi:muramidase (phage lysozyme)
MAITPPESFVWGFGGKRRTPEQIERDQKMALLLMKQGTDYSPVQHWTQGGARVMSALAGVVRERRADEAALQNAKHSEGIINSLLNAQTAPSAPASQPQSMPPFVPQRQNASPFAPPPATTDATPSMQEAPVAQPTQTPPTTNGELTPHQRALLETIAGPESAGNYNIMYSPQQRRFFENFADHPRSPARILKGPNAGRVSDAAGKYQFLSRTWDQYKNKLGLTDFSPQSQDRAAWALASDVYKQRTGQDLSAVLQSGDPQALANVGRILSGTWTSLPG